jgi:hypothetical protein
MTRPLRIAYCAILRLHPVGFRAEFGDEMLWIFDEESQRGAALPLLWDGLRSIVVQGFRPRVQQHEAVGPIYIELDSSLPSERFAQIALTAIFCVLSMTFFLSMLVPGAAIPFGSSLYAHIRQMAPSSASSVPHHAYIHRSAGSGR